MAGSCGRVYEVALPYRKKSRLEGFLIFACIHRPYHCWCPSRVKDAFAALGVASSSSHQFLAVKPFNRFAYGMHGISLSSGFCSCGRCSHYPFAACLNLSPVRDSKNCPAVGNLRVQFGVDLILSSLMVSLVETQVLPTDGANCRVSFLRPKPSK